MGTPSFDAILVKEIITDFKRRRNGVSRVTTRGGPGKTVEKRVASVSLYKLELASLNGGWMNLELLQARDEFKKFKFFSIKSKSKGDLVK
jgi:beta-keto acid cleavage enzyme